MYAHKRQMTYLNTNYESEIVLIIRVTSKTVKIIKSKGTS